MESRGTIEGETGSVARAGATYDTLTELSPESLLVEEDEVGTVGIGQAVSFSSDSVRLRFHLDSSAMITRDDAPLILDDAALATESSTDDVAPCASPANSDHCHQNKARDSKSRGRARKQLIVACVLCSCFMVAEIVGGYFANSLAIITDAAHLMSDVASMVISLVAIWVATRPATYKMSFGFYRAEVLGALVSILIIWILTGVLFYLAIQRCINRDYEIDADVMLITAACGVAINLVLGVVLHQTGAHGHSHSGNSAPRPRKAPEGQRSYGNCGGGDCASIDIQISDGHDTAQLFSRGQRANGDADHAPWNITTNDSWGPDACHATDDPPLDIQIGDGRGAVTPPGGDPRGQATAATQHGDGEKKDSTNINVRAAFIHVIGDLIQSFGVLTAAYIIKYKPEYKLADPICTFIFSVLVLFTTISILKDALNILMEGTPRNIDYEQLRSDLENIQEVRSAHSLHVWSLTLDTPALAVHLAIGDGSETDKVLLVASRLVQSKYNIYHSTIQVEKYQETVMRACLLCQGPSC